MVKEIPLSRGHVAIVSDEDYERTTSIKWYAEPKVSTSGRVQWYGRGRDRTNGRKLVYLHVFLTGKTDGFEIDHIDANGLNCTRENMRLATPAENGRNKRVQHNSKSGFKGVSRRTDTGKWRARVMLDGKVYALITTDDREFAARVYDVGAFYLHGTFARLNFDELDDAAIAHVDAWFIRNRKESMIR